MGIKNSGSCIFALPSVTYAMRATQLLAVYKIPSEVITLSSGKTRKGCAHGIALNCKYLQKAKNILLSESIPISEVTGG